MEDLFEKIVELAKRRGFFWPSYEIYGGVAGFYDMGPYGYLLKRRIIDKWREFFVVRHQEYVVEVDGEEFNVRVMPVGGFMEITQAAEQRRAPPKDVEGGIKAPMQGMIVKINVKKGDKVSKGDVVAVLEAMKMQNDVVANRDGTVEEIFVEEGANVSAGDVIMAVR